MRTWIFGVAFVLVMVSTAQADQRRPNVVLFLVDDMGWRDSSAYGSTFYRTPQMERLAA